MSVYSKEELFEAKRQIDSTIHKLICNDHCQEINFAKNHHKLFNCI
jgi:hypothetical protein